MADNSSSTGLGLIIGGLVVVAGILAYFILGGRAPTPVPDTSAASTAASTAAPAASSATDTASGATDAATSATTTSP